MIAAPNLPFTACAGLVRGEDHAQAHRNAQDACNVHVSAGGIVAVVADGCSSGESSEVGAGLASAWIARNALAIAARHAHADERGEAIGHALTAYLRTVATGLATREAELPEIVHTYLLFSLLVAIVTESDAIVLGAGDGIYAVDGAETALDPGADNAPDYIAYDLLENAPIRSRIRVHHASNTCDLTSLVVATDGALDLQRRAAEPIDGAPQGGLDQFARDARYARNPSLLRKRLTVIGALHRRLHDDTAIAMIVRCAS